MFYYKVDLCRVLLVLIWNISALLSRLSACQTSRSTRKLSKSWSRTSAATTTSSTKIRWDPSFYKLFILFSGKIATEILSTFD